MLPFGLLSVDQESQCFAKLKTMCQARESTSPGKQMCALYAVAPVGMTVVGTILTCPADILQRRAAPCIGSMLAPLKCIINDVPDFTGVCSRFWTATHRHATISIYSFTLKYQDIIGKSTLLICLNRNMLLYSHCECQCQCFQLSTSR